MILFVKVFKHPVSDSKKCNKIRGKHDKSNQFVTYAHQTIETSLLEGALAGGIVLIGGTIDLLVEVAGCETVDIRSFFLLI